MLAVLAIVTSGAYFEVSRNEREQLLSAKARAAAMVTELFAAGVTAPLSFNDEQGIREHIALLMTSPNVVYGGVWGVNERGERGERLGQVARVGGVPEAPRALPTQVVVERTEEVIVVEEPVVGASGEILGAVRVAFSLTPENTAIAAVKRRTLITSLALGIGLGGVLLALSGTLVVRRLARLAEAAKRLEDGDIVEVDVDSNDEVGRLARAFTSMSDAIASREAHISARNRDLRRVLDNVAEGMLTVSMDGQISHERSRALDSWFGAPTDGATFFEYVATFSPSTAGLLRVGWLALTDDFMPVEVILDQMPCRFAHLGRFYDIEYQPIWKGEAECQILDQVLVVVRDVTAVVERERAERAQGEALEVFRQILLDPAGFREFQATTCRLVEAITQGPADPSRLRRDVHTLKGNAATYGLDSVAVICHRIEARLQEEAGTPTSSELADLRAAWRTIGSFAEQLAGGVAEDRVELSRAEYDAHVAHLEGGIALREIVASARNWINEPATTRLRRLRDQGRSVARRLGKPATLLETHVTPTSLRLPAERWSSFWAAFAHMLRNALDHGIETANERTAAGKSPVGRVEISLTAVRTGVELRLSDDGRGVAWESVRERAAELGLPHESRADLEEALYADGMTTRTSATQTSGRGLGLGAVRDEVRACGGTISIETAIGRGTTFVFRFPVSMLDAPRRELPSTAPRVA